MRTNNKRLFLFLLILSFTLLADTFTTQQGSEGIDTGLSPYSGQENYNYGTDVRIHVYGWMDSHILIKFDVSSIPSGATCNSATMSLYIAEAAIEFDVASEHANGSTSTKLSWSHTIGSRSNRILVTTWCLAPLKEDVR